MRKTVFRDIPDVAKIELQFQQFDKLMKDEREALLVECDVVSLKLFGITERDTLYAELPDGSRPPSDDEWEANFEFLYWVYDEEPQFWDAFQIDVGDEDGEELACMQAFGRQLVCALKRLHPAARLKFRDGGSLSDAQIEAEAEAWGRLLTADRR